MKIVKRWIEISEGQKVDLINKLSELLTWLIKDKKIEAKDIAVRTGIPGSALSHIKNKKIDMISNWKVILTAVSFEIDTNNFNADKALGDIRTNHWDNLFNDHFLGSNVYHIEIAEFKSWIGIHERSELKQFIKEGENAMLAGQRIHEAMEEKILAGEIVDMLGSGEVVEKTLFDTEMANPMPTQILGKPLADMVKDNQKADGAKFNSPLFDTISDALVAGQRFNTAQHMPKDFEGSNQSKLIKMLKQEKEDLAKEIVDIKIQIKPLNTKLQIKEIRYSAINRMLDLYEDETW